MKVVLRSSSLPLTLLGILMNVGVARVDTGLRRGIIGRLRIGMSIDAVKAELGVASNGGGSLALGPEPGVAAEFLNGSLIRCQVMSRRYRTPEGIGVGSASADLERAYPLVWEEPGVAFVKSLRMRFLVQDGKVGRILVS
jgi:hypothetical protein